MILVKNKWFPFGNYKAINICGYVALNAQYHDNIELYKEWFGEDNIENIKDKIIESAIVNWFEDEDAGIEKVWNYFRAI